MLQTIRERFTGPIALAVIGAIAITLVISFGNMDTGGAVGSFAAEINGEEIPLVGYQRVVQNQTVRQQEIFQGALPGPMQEQLERNVLESLVRNKVVTQYARDAGYRVSDQVVKNYIRSLPVFQVGGEYSYESYVAVLSSQGMSPEEFERDQKAALEIGQLENGIVESAFYTPAEYRRYIALLAEQREVAYLSFDPISLSTEVKVSGDALRAYYDANPREFETEESVDLEYIEIRLEDISRSVVVDEAAVQEYYEANLDRYRTREQRQAGHILIAVDGETDDAAAGQLAAELAQRLADGEDFVALAAEYSDDTVSGRQGGDLGWAGRGDFVSAFEEVLFALEQGETSDPVRTEFGYHLIRLEGVRPGAQKPFEEMRDELLQELRLRQATDQFYALAEQVDDLALEAATSLDSVAEESGLELKSAKDFSRAGGEPFGFNRSLVEAMFSVAVLEDGENSPLIEISGDHAVVLRVVEHRPSKLLPFEDLKKTLEEIVRLELAAQEANARGREVLARLRGGEAIADLATKYGFELITPDSLSRGSDAVDAQLLAAIFRAPKPVDGAPLFQGVPLGNGGYAVFRLDRVRAGRPEEIPQEQRDVRKRDLAQLNGSSAAAALVTDLRSDADVFVAPGLFDRPEIL